MTEGRNELGHFAKGNRIWEARERAGIPPRFETAQDLESAIRSYLRYISDTPFLEQKAVAGKGVVTIERQRPPTITGLCGYIGISRSSWYNWIKSRPDLLDAIARAETNIRADIEEGAFLGVYDPGFAKVVLGLKEKAETDNRVTVVMSREDAEL